jgi:hypothetical protein
VHLFLACSELWFWSFADRRTDDSKSPATTRRSTKMYGIIYLVGLIVVVMAVLSLVGLR